MADVVKHRSGVHYNNTVKYRKKDGENPIETEGTVYLKTVEPSGGVSERGRWHTYDRETYYQLPNEEAREKCIAKGSKRDPYTGHTISYYKIEKSEIPTDAHIVNLANLYQ